MNKPTRPSEFEHEIRMEWDAINGTLRSIQSICNDPVILDRIEVIIKHAKMLGNFETALKRGVAP